MFLDVFSNNPFASNCWAVSADGSEEIVLVDPGFYPDRLLDMVRGSGKRLAAVLATHGHADHVAASPGVCDPDVPFYIHEEDELALTDAEAWGSGMPVPMTFRPKEVRTVRDGDVLSFAGFEIRVAHTPGHTPGSVCYVTDGFLFSGDLVFRDSIGRHDFPNSDATDMMTSLRWFLSLEDRLRVYPGHGPETTVGRERKSNEWLRTLVR
jgi:hydroxyacylglutathione hydrolase